MLCAKCLQDARDVLHAFQIQVQAEILVARVRRRIGRSPNVEPRGVRERWLWLGWMLVVVVWVGQPWVAASGVRWAGWQPIPALVSCVAPR